MPDEVKRVVGSFSGTSGAPGIRTCPLASKNEIYLSVISLAVTAHIIAWLGDVLRPFHLCIRVFESPVRSSWALPEVIM